MTLTRRSAGRRLLPHRCARKLSQPPLLLPHLRQAQQRNRHHHHRRLRARSWVACSPPPNLRSRRRSHCHSRAGTAQRMRAGMARRAGSGPVSGLLPPSVWTISRKGLPNRASIFQDLDKNEDGVLDIGEIRAALARAGIDLGSVPRGDFTASLASSRSYPSPTVAGLLEGSLYVTFPEFRDYLPRLPRRATIPGVRATSHLARLVCPPSYADLTIIPFVRSPRSSASTRFAKSLAPSSRAVYLRSSVVVGVEQNVSLRLSTLMAT
ncbi:hypothetical protein V8E36_005443 [Tilletia maclaganii]